MQPDFNNKISPCKLLMVSSFKKFAAFIEQFITNDRRMKSTALKVALAGIVAIWVGDLLFSGQILWRLATSISFIEFGVGLSGLALGYYLDERYTKKFTKVVDLMWIGCGAVGVSIIFCESFLVPTSSFLETRWKDIDFEIEHHHLKDQAKVICPDLSRIDVLHPCNALDIALRPVSIPMRIAGAKGFLAHYQTIFDQPVPADLVTFAKALEAIGNSQGYTMVEKYKGISRPLMWHFFVVVAIGFRLSKALIDLLLL
jgi:hypothetical protein